MRVLLCLLLCGCSLKTIALRSLADALAEPGNTFARDDDPELIRESLPLLLKIMETLHDGLNDHKNIRLALARGFTSYGVAFIQDDADRLSEVNVGQGKERYERSRRLCLRGYTYGLEGLEIAAPGFRADWESSKTDAALARLKKDDVALLYWTAAALGSAIASAKGDMKLVGRLPLVEKMMARALELDESFDEGALQEFFITDEMVKGVGRGGGPAKAKAHYERALVLSKNKKLSPIVTYAESVLVDQQDKTNFIALLERVVKANIDEDLDHRLVNAIAQKRARWLLSRVDELFAN